MPKTLWTIWWHICQRASAFIFIYLTLIISARSQELQCEVQINSQGVQSVDKRVITDMQRAIRDFMNNRRWTNDNFKVEERIKCTLFFTLSGTVGNYTASVQVLANRPVYGTTYETRLLNFLDKEWAFNYVEGQPLDFQNGSFTNNLTSLLAYYAYIIVGLDYDSFTKLGGRNSYIQAQQVGQNATQGGLKGWNAFDGTNTRYFLLENLQSQQFAAFRESLYEYYRKGLDQFSEGPEKAEQARVVLLDLLKKLKAVYDQKPTSILINTFLDMKADEFINMMKEGKPEQKQEAYTILSQIDPTKTERYQVLIK